MKNLLFILFYLAFPGILFSQDEVTLDSCYLHTRENYPNLEQAGILNEITILQKENIHSNSLPNVALNGQATYQSEVTSLDISLPGISIPRPARDQYKFYAEIRQSIWDGGISSSSLKLEDALLRTHLNELEVELYKLNEQVSQAFFTVLFAKKQLEVLDAQKRVLEEKKTAAESAVRHGTAEKTSVLIIQAEILNLDQNTIQLETVRDASAQMLSLLTGKNISSDSEFIFNGSPHAEQRSLLRPEMHLFESQRLQLDSRMELLDKSRNPKIFGFGQAGYGRPGLNMLSDQFNSFYLIGAGISWNVFDWKRNTRQKQVLQLQQKGILAQQETFNLNISILLAHQQEEINKLKKMLETDKELVALRSEVIKVASSRLENETITTSEYIRELQTETIAKLNYELHKIQLNQAYEKYNLLKGKE